LKQIPDARLVAVADLNAEKAARLAQTMGVTRVYKSDIEMLKDKEIDAVIFATPSGLHADQAVRAMQAGKHVIVEKPMDITLDACDRMVAAEKQAGKKLAIISQHRWDHSSIFVKDAVTAGKLGKLILVEVSVKWWRTQQYYDAGDWRGTWALDGGGALMNQGVHTVDLMQWMAGPVKSVYAKAATGGHERIEVEDVVVATLQFASGAIGTLTASTACYDGQPARLDLYGTEGSAVIEGDRLKLFNLKDGTTADAEAVSQHALSVARGGTASVKDEAVTRLGDAAKRDPGAVWGDAHREQIRDFMRAIRSGGTPLIHGAEGRKPIEIIRAIYKSAERGAVVELG
jgi:predicted dehydrogenase